MYIVFEGALSYTAGCFSDQRTCLKAEANCSPASPSVTMTSRTPDSTADDDIRQPTNSTNKERESGAESRRHEDTCPRYVDAAPVVHTRPCGSADDVVGPFSFMRQGHARFHWAEVRAAGHILPVELSQPWPQHINAPLQACTLSDW